MRCHDPLMCKKEGRPLGRPSFGTADGIRTHDLQSRSLALYPAELQPHTAFRWIPYFIILSLFRHFVKENFFKKIVKNIDKLSLLQ